MLAQTVANGSKLDALGSTSVAKQERPRASGVTSGAAARKKFNFIKKTLDKLPLPTNGQRAYFYDSSTRGLALAVSPAGKKVFVLYRKVAGRPERITIGTYPDLTIEQARGEAATLNGRIAKGENPASKRRDSQNEMTLSELLDDYISRHLKQHAKRPDVAETNARWMFKKYLTRWSNRTLGVIRRKDVLALQAEIAESGHTSSNRVLQLLRAMFNFAISQEVWSGENPCSRIKLFHEAKRTRFVQSDEMPKLFAALKTEPNPDVVDFVNLSLWTGARKSDVLSMRWQDIELADNRWNVPDPKNRIPYQIALTPEAVEILKSRQSESPWVFPSETSASGHLVDLKGRWKELLKRAKIKGLRQHDLRRTLGSWQAGLGASLQIIGGSLGHQSLAATQVYSQLQLDSIRASVNAATQAMIAASKRKPQLLGDGK